MPRSRVVLARPRAPQPTGLTLSGRRGRACKPPPVAAPSLLATRSQPFRRAVCRSGTLRRRPSSRWAQDHGHVVTLGLVQPPDCFVVHRLSMYLDHVTGPGIPRDPRQQGRPRQVRQKKGRRPGRTSVARLTSQRTFHTSAALYPACRAWGAPTSSTMNTGTGNGRHFGPSSFPAPPHGLCPSAVAAPSGDRRASVSRSRPCCPARWCSPGQSAMVVAPRQDCLPQHLTVSVRQPPLS